MTSEGRGRLEVIEAKVDTLLVRFDYFELAIRDHEEKMRSVE